MGAKRDLDTEALAWAVCSLGLPAAHFRPLALSSPSEPLRYVETVKGSPLALFVDLSVASRPTLLLAPQEDAHAAREAFAAGERTPVELLALLRAYYRGHSKELPQEFAHFE